jgi:hypothetical protein
MSPLEALGVSWGPHKPRPPAPMRELLARAPWQAPGGAAAAALLCTSAAAAAAGFAASFALSYNLDDGANHYTGVWLCGFTLVLVAQAGAIAFGPPAVGGGGGRTARARAAAWLWFAAWMGAASLVLLVGMAAPGMAPQYAWAFLWWPPVTVIATGVLARRRASFAAAPPAAAAAAAFEDPATAAAAAAAGVHIDVVACAPGAPAARPPACSAAAWRGCWSNYWAFVGWSSLFWLAALGFFLALQVRAHAGGRMRTSACGGGACGQHAAGGGRWAAQSMHAAAHASMLQCVQSPHGMREGGQQLARIMQHEAPTTPPVASPHPSPPRPPGSSPTREPTPCLAACTRCPPPPAAPPAPRRASTCCVRAPQRRGCRRL